MTDPGGIDQSPDANTVWFVPAVLHIAESADGRVVLISTFGDGDALGAALDQEQSTILLNALLEAMAARNWLQ